MNRDELRGTLERLHAELASTPAVDERTRTMLEQLQADVRGVLASESPDARLRDRLEHAFVQFEASYPSLARSLAQVIDTLGVWGI
ncbi:MAG TPA: DUF4404 family protein [Gemmatimonadales bacterium]|nr:DUF4404 family protein [Gemmatimonadales bacterium]